MTEDNPKIKYYLAEQGSDEWFEIRKKLAVTASNFGTIAKYIKEEIEVEELNQTCLDKLYQSDYLPSRIDAKPFSAFSVRVMQEGNRLESLVREWFAQSGYLGEGYQVIEVGIAVNSDYPDIGASVDSLVLYQGKIVAGVEIKTVPSLDHHRLNSLPLTDKIKTPIYYNHYAQIQGGMAIIDVPLFYYIVYGRDDNQIRVDQFTFDEDYWTQDLYPDLLAWIERIQIKENN